MEKIRAAVVGFGGMGRQYVQMLDNGEIDDMVLAGACCRNEKGQNEIRTAYPGVSVYPNVEAMFGCKDEFDAAVVVTPHATHVEIGKMAAAAGKHILLDKPAGISTKEVKELLVAAERAGVSLGMIFNTRMNRVFFRAKEMIERGELGRLNRAVWISNIWFRTPAYHNSASWRSTWAGEHGGLLINQSQHFLDVWQWLFGMPDHVLATVECGKYSDITVDDSMDVQFFYDNGLHGTFIASSGEYPGVNRLEIWGTKGRLCIEDSSQILFDENVVPTDEFSSRNQEIYGMPEHHAREITVEKRGAEGYQKIFRNFTDHLRYGEPLLATGEDGLRGVMIANGAYLSSWLKKKVDFPIDDERYAAMLEEKAAEERRAGK
ncbi:Gfo/Idh/MocA family protein [Hungatella sp.]|uniref:Gfo/Idh/MocA family protein n=1 Tax=Hungatella sp. TaxID=2613924 RepID=UPI003AB742BB